MNVTYMIDMSVVVVLTKFDGSCCEMRKSAFWGAVPFEVTTSRSPRGRFRGTPSGRGGPSRSASSFTLSLCHAFSGFSLAEVASSSLALVSSAIVRALRWGVQQAVATETQLQTEEIVYDPEYTFCWE